MKCTDCEDGKVEGGVECATCSGTGFNGSAVEVEETETEVEDDTAEETAKETE